MSGFPHEVQRYGWDSYQNSGFDFVDQMSDLGYDQGSGFGFADQTSGLDFELADQMSGLGCD